MQPTLSETRHQRRYTRPAGRVMVRALIKPDMEEQIRQMAIRESRTMSAMIELILTKALSNGQGQA